MLRLVAEGTAQDDVRLGGGRRRLSAKHDHSGSLLTL
jgi:hypothetical protein